MRAGLAAELKRLVRDGAEWPIRDRRRFRNLLLDAVSSDAMPLAELLLRAHDDGLLQSFPDRRAARPLWDTATARLASDLQTQRFVEPGIARFVADAWANALGPDAVSSARVASPRPVVAPRLATRSSANAGATSTTGMNASVPARPSAAATANANNAASIQLYKRANFLMLMMAGLFTIFVVLAFRDTSNGSAAPTPAPMPLPAAPRSTQPASQPISQPISQPATASPVPTGAAAPPPSSPDAPGRDSAGSAADSALLAARPSVAVAAAPARTSDDIVLNTGRIVEGRVLSVRQQSVVVKDEAIGLDFEIAKADIDRIVTRDGRIMRFTDDNVPLLGSGDDLTPMSHAGQYQLRYTERWGTEKRECSEMSRKFAPGADVVVRHLRGAPMLKLEFVNGQGFNAAVRTDGLFESGADVSPTRGPRNAFVSTRLSGRITRAGALQGIARLSAVTSDGTVICDLALTVRGERLP